MARMQSVRDVRYTAAIQISGSDTDIVKLTRMTPKAITRRLSSFYHTTVSDTFGCEPARCGKINRHPIMNAAMTADAIGRLNARPPWFTGLSRKSPTVAPSGRVRMNAAQNSVTRDIFVQ